MAAVLVERLFGEVDHGDFTDRAQPWRQRVADLSQPGSPSTAERIASRHQAFAAAPADQYPRVVAAAAAMAGTICTEQYLRGLHRLLDGISARSVQKR